MRRFLLAEALVLAILGLMPLLSCTSAPEAREYASTPSPTLGVLFPSATPQPTPSPTAAMPMATPYPTTEPTMLDSDGDLFPDQVEEAMGWDPFVNECIEAIGVAMNILLILDASDNMAGEISEEPKTDVAKEALSHYVDSLPVGVNAGLMVYGHKGNSEESGKAESCAGVELIYPIGPLNKQAFRAALVSFSPAGWAPIALCLEEAEKAFAGMEGQTNRILLVSTSQESCGGQPCQVAESLKKEAIEVTGDTIGLGVDEATRDQLQCIANALGGLYYDAPTADDFSKAWDIQRRKTGEWAKLAGDKMIIYQRCLSDRMREFTTWARSSGWQSEHTDEFSQITKAIIEEMGR